MTLDELLDRHSGHVKGIVEKLREAISKAAPEMTESVYPVWRAIGCRHPDSGYICGIFPMKDHVKLYFEHGRFLPDFGIPLEGNGKQTRFISLTTKKEIKPGALKKLVTAAIVYRMK